MKKNTETQSSTKTHSLDKSERESPNTEIYVKAKSGDRIVFTGLVESDWRCECTIISVSDPQIVRESTHRTFSGITDDRRAVGGYLDQILEIV